jgi:hypothetical protein
MRAVWLIAFVLTGTWIGACSDDGSEQQPNDSNRSGGSSGQSGATGAGGSLGGSGGSGGSGTAGNAGSVTDGGGKAGEAGGAGAGQGPGGTTGSGGAAGMAGTAAGGSSAGASSGGSSAGGASAGGSGGGSRDLCDGKPDGSHCADSYDRMFCRGGKTIGTMTCSDGCRDGQCLDPGGGTGRYPAFPGRTCASCACSGPLAACEAIQHCYALGYCLEGCPESSTNCVEECNELFSDGADALASLSKCCRECPSNS